MTGRQFHIGAVHVVADDDFVDEGFIATTLNHTVGATQLVDAGRLLKQVRTENTVKLDIRFRFIFIQIIAIRVGIHHLVGIVIFLAGTQDQ